MSNRLLVLMETPLSDTDIPRFLSDSLVTSTVDEIRLAKYMIARIMPTKIMVVTDKENMSIHLAMTSLKKGNRVFTGYLRYYWRLGKALGNGIAVCKPGTQRRFGAISGRRAWMSRIDTGMDESDSQPPAVTSSCSYGWGKLGLTVPVVGWSKRLMFCWCKLCITESVRAKSYSVSITIKYT